MKVQEIVSKIANILKRDDLVSYCGLAEGTNNATIKTTLPFFYMRNGKKIWVDPTDNIPMTVCPTQYANTTCYYLITIDRHGVFTTTKGTNNVTALPETPRWHIPIGAIKVVTGSSSWTAGVDDLSAVTATYYDIDAGDITFYLKKNIKKLETRYNFKHMRIKSTANTSYYLMTNWIPNLKKLIRCYIVSDNIYYPLHIVDEDVALSYYPNANSTGRPIFISPSTVVETSPINDNATPTFKFLLTPAPDKTYTVQIEAYHFSPELDGVIYESNWWTDNAEDLLIYGTLIDMQAYVMNDERMPIWVELYKDLLNELKKYHLDEQYEGPLNIKDALSYEYRTIYTL